MVCDNAFNQIQSLQWFCINLSNQGNYKFLDIYFSDIFGRTCQLYSATFNRTLYGTFLSGVTMVKSSGQLFFFQGIKTTLGSFYSFINACSQMIFCGNLGYFFFLVKFAYLSGTCQLKYFLAQTSLLELYNGTIIGKHPTY